MEVHPVTQPTPPANAADSTTPPAQPPAGKPDGDQKQAHAPKFDGDFDPEKAAALFANLRNETEAEKAKRQALEEKLTQQEDLSRKEKEELAKLLGFGPKDADPEGTTKKLADLEAKHRETVVENAVYKAAINPKVGADPARMIDSRSFMAKVGQLDPASKTFETDIASAVSAAVEADPSLKVAGASPDGSKGKGSVSGGDWSAVTASTTKTPSTPHERLTAGYAQSGK
jgi:hypothetical protein